MSAKEEELPPEDPVTISPAKVVVEAGNWQESSLFTVQNSADEILYQIRVKVIVDHPHIRIQDFTIESPNQTDELHAGVGQTRTGSDFVVLPHEGSGKKATYVVIRRLNPGENWQFIITKRSPYVPSSHYALYASIVGFDREPALR